ncbi:hypothetical protein LRS74_05140 [Streptomyces sp. LX-29]|uniref:hypothetical protein n=1 Tax=Streptomyces sp. LX-29 TaxID=2900152 RepID=UPI00240E66DB|nr:hypothetical protein [Streptomyces sp. LX-29]WFB06496.1 hypothetical protein LRS74_05140 [Streptomyces sp. LX-29]
MEARHVGHVLRALRAAVFAAVCVLLAALGHAVMSGSDIPLWAVAGSLLATGVAAWGIAGRERGPLVITAATVGAQLALHNLFTYAQNTAPRPDPTAGHTPLSEAGLSPSDLVCGDLVAAAGQQAGHAAMAGHSMSHGGYNAVGMWSAHVLVALVCGAWLSGGEQAAFRLGRTLAVRIVDPLLRRFLPGVRPVAVPHRVRAARHAAPERLRHLLLVHVIATRGPPAVAAVG